MSYQVYEVLVQTSPTPLSLFAFEYYRSFLSACEKDPAASSGVGPSTSETVMMQIGGPAETAAGGGGESRSGGGGVNVTKKERRIGRGHKKALVRWYTARSEIELLALVTKYKHSHSWTNKDLFKLIHMKPRNEGSIPLFFRL